MSHTNQFSISPIAAAVSAALATPAAALAQEEGTSVTLDEIIVTATKREENLQKIPSSVQALPEAMLQEIGALNTEDFTRFVPSVNWANFNTGGDNYIIFRGVHSAQGAFTMTRSSSVYLDEISLTATDGSQPDLRIFDVARVEALSGPQGTLFGAAAQSGTLRVITNQPDTSKFEANADVQLRTGSESDRSHSIAGMINIPLVEDVFAIRIAGVSAVDGGYIDNILGHQPNGRFGILFDNSNGGSYHATKSELGNSTNSAVVEENWNSTDIFAVRVSARWNINDDWAATIAYHYGDTDAHASSAYNPWVGDLETIGFFKGESRDEWDMWALTIEADLGFAQLVSATSFYDRQRTWKVDNTLYYKYYQASPYYCIDSGAAPGNGGLPYYWLFDNNATGRSIYLASYCPTPLQGGFSGDVTKIPDMPGFGGGPSWQEKFAQEIRLSHQGDKIDWLAGLYYEDSNDSWNSVWLTDSSTPYTESISYQYFVDQTASGVCHITGQAFIPGRDPDQSCPGAEEAVANADHYWHSYDDTDWTQTAVFGEVTWHIGDNMNLTVGGRWFDTENTKIYTKWNAGGTDGNGRATGTFLQPRWNGNEIPQTRNVSEFVPKIAFSYDINDDSMGYALYTEGYRVGGINRANIGAIWSLHAFPQEWDPDKLKNYEIGYKSQWAGDRVRLNVTGFHMDWDNFQTEFVDPKTGDCYDPADPKTSGGFSNKCWDMVTVFNGEIVEQVPDGRQDVLPWISIVGNVGDAHITGLTAEADWIATDSLTLGGNLQWLAEAEIDSINGDPGRGLVPGLHMPNTPEIQGALWGTYTWQVSGFSQGSVFLRGQVSYNGETTSRLIPAPMTSANPSFTNDSYQIADLRLGLVSGDGRWQIDLFVNNITDERAHVATNNMTGSTNSWAYSSTGEYEHGQFVNTVRPREFGVRFFARWDD